MYVRMYAGGGGRDEVWNPETMVSQLSRRSRGGQRVIVFFPTLNILMEARSELEPAEEMIKKLKK